MQGRYHGELFRGAYRHRGDYRPRDFDGQRFSWRGGITGQAEEVHFRRSGDAFNAGTTLAARARIH